MMRCSLQEINSRGEAIHLEVHGDAASPLTNGEAVRIQGLCTAALAVWGVQAGERRWWTIQHEHGTVGGCWAHSVEEAVLFEAVWCGVVAWCVQDDGLEVHRRYFPKGKRSTVEAVHGFPVTDGPISGDPLDVPLEGALF